MLTSPESYYEMEIKGKTKQEILKEIRSLKRRINEDTIYLEESHEEPVEMYPDRRSMVSLEQQYLEYAIKGYEEAGGVYTLTKAEQKSRDFNELLDSLQRLVLTIHSYSGKIKRACTVHGEAVTVRAVRMLNPIEFFDYGPVPKEEFISVLKEMHMGEWRRRYSNPEIEDGVDWKLEIEFADGKIIRKSGYNAYPYNFSDLTHFLKMDSE